MAIVSPEEIKRGSNQQQLIQRPSFSLTFNTPFPSFAISEELEASLTTQVSTLKPNIAAKMRSELGIFVNLDRIIISTLEKGIQRIIPDSAPLAELQGKKVYLNCCTGEFQPSETYQIVTYHVSPRDERPFQQKPKRKSQSYYDDEHISIHTTGLTSGTCYPREFKPTTTIREVLEKLRQGINRNTDAGDGKSLECFDFYVLTVEGEKYIPESCYDMTIKDLGLPNNTVISAMIKPESSVRPTPSEKKPPIFYKINCWLLNGERPVFHFSSDERIEILEKKLREDQNLGPKFLGKEIKFVCGQHELNPKIFFGDAGISTESTVHIIDKPDLSLASCISDRNFLPFFSQQLDSKIQVVQPSIQVGSISPDEMLPNLSELINNPAILQLLVKRGDDYFISGITATGELNFTQVSGEEKLSLMEFIDFPEIGKRRFSPLKDCVVPTFYTMIIDNIRKWGVVSSAAPQIIEETWANMPYKEKLDLIEDYRQSRKAKLTTPCSPVNPPQEVAGAKRNQAPAPASAIETAQRQRERGMVAPHIQIWQNSAQQKPPAKIPPILLLKPYQ